MAWAVGPLGTGLHPLVRGAAQPGSGPRCHAMRLTYSSATTATTSTQRSSRKHTQPSDRNSESLLRMYAYPDSR